MLGVQAKVRQEKEVQINRTDICSWYDVTEDLEESVGSTLQLMSEGNKNGKAILPLQTGISHQKMKLEPDTSYNSMEMIT